LTNAVRLLLQHWMHRFVSFPTLFFTVFLSGTFFLLAAVNRSSDPLFRLDFPFPFHWFHAISVLLYSSLVFLFLPNSHRFALLFAMLIFFFFPFTAIFPSSSHLLPQLAHLSHLTHHPLKYLETLSTFLDTLLGPSIPASVTTPLIPPPSSIFSHIRARDPP